MKKVLLISASSIVLAGAVGFYTYDNLTSQDPVTVKETTVTNNDSEEVIEIKEEKAEPVEDEFPMDMSEEAIKKAIHGMSHQKVEAEDKWGFIPLTAERVNRLIAVVEKNKGSYQNSDLYLDILNRWKDNDFSRADSDHNAIWNLQGGTIGKASGVLSVEEEKAFIEEHFDIE